MDIQDYSQSNLVMPNSVQCLIGVGEKNKVEDHKIGEEEEMKEQNEEVKGKDKVNSQPLLLSTLLFSFLFSSCCWLIYLLQDEQFREPKIEGADKIFEEVEKGFEAIKGTKFEGKFE